MLLDYELIGNLQISNGIVSGFNNSTSNYIKIPYSLPMGSNKVEFCLSLYYPSLSSMSTILANYNDAASGGGLVLRSTTTSRYSDIQYWGWNSSGSMIAEGVDPGFDLTAGTNIIKFVYENSTITWYKSINGKDFTRGITKSGTIADFKNYLVIGASGTAWYSGNMQVNMLDSYIKVNDEYWHSKEYSKQKTKIIQRHDTAANWTAVNPVLAAGEMGVETDTSRFKFGDGTSTWTELEYAGAGTGGSGTQLTSADGATTYSELALGDTFAVIDTSTKELNKLTQTGGTLNSELEFTGASGASLKMTEKYNLNTADSWELQIKYKHNGGGNSPTIFGYASGSDYKTPAFILEGGSFKFFLSSNGGSWNINSSGSGLVPQAGTIYYFKIGFTGSQYYIKYNTTGWSDEFTTQWTLNSTTKVYCSDYFMLMNLSLNNRYYNTGTMYLQDTALIINGAEVWRGVNVTPGPNVLNAKLDELLAGKQNKLTPISPIKIYPEEQYALNGTMHGGTLSDDFIYKAGSGTYIELPEFYDLSTADTWEFKTKWTFDGHKTSAILGHTGTTSDKQGPLLLYDGYSELKLLTSYTGSSWNISLVAARNISRDTYYIKTGFNGTQYYLSYSKTGFDNMTTVTASSTTKMYCTANLTLGGYPYNTSAYSSGGIYLEDTSLAINGNIIYKALKIENSVYNISTLPATTTSLGVVQPDGTSITVNEAGVISGQDVKTFTGYSDTGTLVLKSINGVLQWVAEG